MVERTKGDEMCVQLKHEMRFGGQVDNLPSSLSHLPFEEIIAASIRHCRRYCSVLQFAKNPTHGACCYCLRQFVFFFRAELANKAISFDTTCLGREKWVFTWLVLSLIIYKVLSKRRKLFYERYSNLKTTHRKRRLATIANLFVKI